MSGEYPPKGGTAWTRVDLVVSAPGTIGEVIELVKLRDRIQAALAIPAEAFTVVAPIGWGGGAPTVHGMPIYPTSDVNRPGLTVDPMLAGGGR